MAKILLAEDTTPTADLLKEDLVSRGHTVSVCSTVEDAVLLLQEDQEEHPNGRDTKYEVAIIDLRFNGYKEIKKIPEAGLEVLKQAVQASFLESIILTAHGTLATAIKAIELGAFRYIEKSTSVEKGVRVTSDVTFFDKLALDVEAAMAMRGRMLDLDASLDQLQADLDKLQDDLNNIEKFLEFSADRPKTGVALGSAKVYVEKARETALAIWQTRGTARAVPLNVRAR